MVKSSHKKDVLAFMPDSAPTVPRLARPHSENMHTNAAAPTNNAAAAPNGAAATNNAAAAPNGAAAPNTVAAPNALAAAAPNHTASPMCTLGCEAELTAYAAADEAHTYHTSGSKRSKGAALSHRQQRDTSSSYRGGSYKAGKASKGGMSASWGC